ncbi:MAG: Na/Pi cotransporter family protein [Candidatus Omnitrophica bacterium]|nr:Na/Pi cotransporter family protein [Candidatus Omnitrophota bacterium]MBU1924764.1 Na/Pi cotransporter family protein [Candidatus Omnitrophota bacterium]MBU2063018.1 Na/Pi cotransporter family protein [Candidatus Omnitrophota bacterium]
MVKELVFGLAGGLGLFIYGIHLMGEGLQNAAGDKLRRLLKALTKNTYLGIIVGTFITAIIQSSSATTVMVVGFVNAGLMTLQQSIGVIFGANIGTTVTAQIIAFKLTALALPAIAIGTCLYLFIHKRFWRFLGLFILGFGVLFLGLQIMTSTVKPLAQNQAVRDIFIAFSHNPFLGIVTGAAVTAIFQSSSVTTGMVIALSSLGLLDLRAAIPLIFGCNIGTCVTALLASLGTNITARRTALAHILFNVMVTLIFIPTLPFYYKIIMLTSSDIARQVANAHTLFNVIGTLIMTPFVGLYVKIVTRILPGKEIIVDTQPKFLEKHLLQTPLVALDAAIKETIRMAELAQSMMGDAMKGFLKGDSKALEMISKKEVVLDNLQEAIADYLMELMQKEISPDIAKKIPALLHSINDIERIGDHSENLLELAERKIISDLPFTQEAIQELQEMFSLVDRMAERIIKGLDTNDINEAKIVLELEDQVNRLTQQLRENHIDRLSEGKCKVLSGIVFLDMVSNYEKIADHLTNVAQAVAGKLQWVHEDDV